MHRAMVAVVLLLLVTATASADEPATITGTLVERHTGDFAHGRMRISYELRTAHGEQPLTDGQRTKLVGQRVKIVDDSAAPGLQGRVLPQDSTRLAAPTDLGAHKVAVVLINFTDNRGTPVTADSVRQRVFTASDSANQYFQSQSGGAVSLVGRDSADGDVYGWYELPISSVGCDIDAYASAANTAATNAGANLSNYDHIVYFFPVVGDCQFSGGIADLPGSKVWINGQNNTAAYAHEIGHNMGVHHSSSIRCQSNGAPVAISDNCSFYEYGDSFDVMGSGEQAHVGAGTAPSSASCP